MPNYRNDGTTNIEIIDDNGFPKVLKPNESSNTIKYYDVTNLTKVSNTPYLNVIAAYTVETFSVAEAHTIVLSSPDIPKIRIMKADGDFDIYLQAEANTPAVLKNWTTTDQPIDIFIEGLCDQIVVVSNETSGTIHIVEYLKR